MQAELDQQWARLVSNDPDIVLPTLSEAFEDNDAPAAPIGVQGDEVSIVVLVPNEEAVPEQLPATTQAGNLTLRKLPKGERSVFYGRLIAGHVLVTLREGFAVAPGINSARLIAVRTTVPDIYGRSSLECMLAGHWSRAAFNGVQWQDADSGKILVGTATELISNEKRGQMVPIDLAAEPEISEVLSGIDTADLSVERLLTDGSRCGRTCLGLWSWRIAAGQCPIDRDFIPNVPRPPLAATSLG